MTDWTAPIGSGTIMIRDTGGNVEFWITAGNSIAFDYGLAWSGWINGRGVGGTFRYEAGMGWQRVFVEHVGSNQSVSFTKNENSGSTGLGGPATVNAYISRATVPPAPTTPVFSNIGHTTARVTFNSQGDGGSGVLEWELHYGADPNGGQFGVSSSGTTDLTNLKLATTYYAWARGRNAVGWGAWSGRGSGRTLAGVRIKVSGVWKEAIAYVKVSGVWKEAIPFIKVSGVWKDGK